MIFMFLLLDLIFDVMVILVTLLVTAIANLYDISIQLLTLQYPIKNITEMI